MNQYSQQTGKLFTFLFSLWLLSVEFRLSGGILLLWRVLMWPILLLTWGESKPCSQDWVVYFKLIQCGTVNFWVLFSVMWGYLSVTIKVWFCLEIISQWWQIHKYQYNLKNFSAALWVVFWTSCAGKDLHLFSAFYSGMVVFRITSLNCCSTSFFFFFNCFVPV